MNYYCCGFHYFFLILKQSDARDNFGFFVKQWPFSSICHILPHFLIISHSLFPFRNRVCGAYGASYFRPSTRVTNPLCFHIFLHLKNSPFSSLSQIINSLLSYASLSRNTVRTSIRLYFHLFLHLKISNTVHTSNGAYGAYGASYFRPATRVTIRLCFHIFNSTRFSFLSQISNYLLSYASVSRNTVRTSIRLYFLLFLHFHPFSSVSQITVPNTQISIGCTIRNPFSSGNQVSTF